MKTANVYTYYDDNKTIIGHVRPNAQHQISEQTYNKLLTQRTVGGTAGIYTDAGYDFFVTDSNGNVIKII